MRATDTLGLGAAKRQRVSWPRDGSGSDKRPAMRHAAASARAFDYECSDRGNHDKAQESSRK
jgi:hypothetical protein